MMRLRILAPLAALWLALPAWAQDVLAPEPGIEAVISKQMEAFRGGDVAGAFEYASPMIRGIFRTPEMFGRMVEQGYPMVWRPDNIDFGALRQMDGRLFQRVIVTDEGGRLHVLEYRMLETEGGWLIDGVQILPQTGVAA
ncbi:DUF4864 domain-containing protein [Roseivivax sp. GX 12232]|uniref:DUF4864 domain-containing protein n=1 Tax=Roseivivax sp. GX 12232 TaxID=2900547 RepID=UPI001E5F9419|nr:DUF4864 domain-containing protein [Roseivivax sp. GX 12232]MCE0506938.1 DUF4864 domain-containing protein [Roseivivax sp. GX 12232]